MDAIRLPISEIFYSIDGEGVRTGLPAIFIRLFGCNLDCSYCDTRYACKTDSGNFSLMSLDEIITRIQQYEPCKKITLTGGEPLIHKDTACLVRVLRRDGYEVNIETNGAVDLYSFIDYQESFEYAGSYFFTMDWKSISSGESDKMIAENLERLRAQDVLKFVVGSIEDLDQMKTVIETNPQLRAQVYVSPIFGQIEPADIVKYVLENQLVSVKVQVQLHKVIWDSNKRGV